MQWGQDFSADGTEAGPAPMEISSDQPTTWATPWSDPSRSGSSVRKMHGAGMSSENLKPSGGLGLSIDTSPPCLEPMERSKRFNKRSPLPISSPGALASSLAQKKKRPAPLLVAENDPSSAFVSVVNTGPYLSKVDLNELALEDIIYEGQSVFGIQSSKGKRRYMEDTCCAFENLDGDGTEVPSYHHTIPFITASLPTHGQAFRTFFCLNHSLKLFRFSQAYYGVFDGHGGRRAADFARDNLFNYISSDKGFGDNIAEALGAAFLKVYKLTLFLSLSVIQK